MGETVAVKWQRMLEVFLQTQAYAIVPFGYAADQTGLGQFNQAMGGLLQAGDSTSTELKDINSEIWDEILRRTFGVDSADYDISIDEARGIVSKVSMQMQSPAFGETIDEAMRGLPANAQDGDKHRALQDLILAVWFDVMQEYDLEGEEGYVQLQAALMDHMSDPQITHGIAAAMYAVVARAGIKME